MWSAVVALSLLLILPTSVGWLVAQVEYPQLLDRTRVREAQAIVVLGAGKRTHAPEFGGETVNRLALERLRYAATLARETRLPMLVSGGAPAGDTPEASLMEAPPAGVRLTPLVGRLPLLQSQAVASHAAVFVGCDGGLMHLAHSTGVPSVTLFSVGEPPAMFLAPGYPSEPLYSADSANQIAPEAVVAAFERICQAHQERWDNSANRSA